MLDETRDKFITWFFEKHLMYGDWFDQWWKKEGQKQFFVWAKAKGQEFLNLEKDES